ncbi:MAG: LysR family transcriptional regulator [Pseudomonas sp.]|uniref:LysR family transcriptional regulator n=1 Tax=Pseudomonas abieticivorans TaxID=2931382 RepID=UPI0020C118C4|nr:LysR family transcriptional regulator [Pseudomonas sp. PIA16]MDE1168009.1 LysR family transcriptional regulator [Pseudomonas sp.]
MDLRDLTYFETIAELGHLGRAAEKLNRSQPALTKSIQRLEESLGTKLFQRDGRRIKLTDVGELLLARGKQLQQSIAETEREVRDFAIGAVGNIRLGCASSMAEYLLPRLTAALLARAPDITLSLVIGQDDLLRESLLSGRLDMIICSMISSDPQLQSHSLLKDEAVVVASANHPIFDGPYKMADLNRYRWVLPGPSVSSRRWVENAFASRQLPPPFVQIETNTISVLPRLIAHTNLLSFLARESLEYGQGMSLLREVPLAQTTMTRTIGVTVRAGAYQSPAAQVMLSMLKDRGQSFFSG